MQRIKTGDTVQVIAGNYLNVQGEVKAIKKGFKVAKRTGKSSKLSKHALRYPNKDRVVVAGVNMVKKHQKPVSQTRTQTGIIEFEAPIHISNVMLVCPSCGEAVRVRFEIEDGKKLRVCKRCDATIDK